MRVPDVRRVASVLVVAAALSAAAPAAASAGPVLAGADGCPPLETTRAFVRFLDPLRYALVPGGTFEDGGAGWSLGPAHVAEGNEPFFVNDAADRLSLALPAGGSVVSATFCARTDTPTLRFFARTEPNGLGSLTGALKVEALARTAGGETLAVPMGVVPAVPAWAPTAPLALAVNALTLPGDATPLAFRFTAVGAAAWRIDDVYVDPVRRS